LETQIILYAQQSVANGNFVNTPSDYGWTLTPSELDDPDYCWAMANGSLAKVSNTGGGLVEQYRVFKPGQTYHMKMRTSARTAGTMVFKNSAGGSTIHTCTTNGQYDFEFTADGEDFVLDMSSAYDGTIGAIFINEIPEQYELDLHEEVNVPMTFSIDDIFNLDQRRTTFSKTITLKGTRNNNIAFNHMFKVAGESMFNPNIKSRCLIKNRGIQFFDGMLCLDSVNETLQNGTVEIEYNVSVVGDVINILELLSHYSLRNLDFSEYDHLYNLNRIKGSWNNDITYNGSDGQANTSNTYTSPSITGITNVVIDGYNHPKFTFASAHSFEVGDEVHYDSPVPLYGTADYSFDQRIIDVPDSTHVVLGITRTVPFSGIIFGTMSKRVFGTTVGSADVMGYWYPCVDHGTWTKIHYAKGWLGGSGLLTAGVNYYIQTYNTGDDFSNVGGLAPAGSPSANNGQVFTAAQANHTSGTLVAGQTYYFTSFVAGDDFANVGGANATDTYFIAGGPPLSRTASYEEGLSDALLVIGQSYMIIKHHPSDDFTNVGAASNNDGVVFTATGTTPRRWLYGSVLTPQGALSPTNWTNGSSLAVITMYPTLWTGPTVLLSTRDITLDMLGGNETDTDTMAPKAGVNYWEDTGDYWNTYDFIPYIFVREIFIKMMDLINAKYDFPLLDSKIFRRLAVPLSQTMNLGEGDMVVMNDWLQDVKLSDIFKSIVNMFNLGVIQDRDTPQLLTFVERNSFYDSATTLDWTDKLDTSEPLTLTMLNKNLALTYTWKYKDATDYWSTVYDAEFGNTNNSTGLYNAVDMKYGMKYGRVRSDFLKNEQKVELIFENGILIQSAKLGQIMPADFFANESGVVSRKAAFKIVILGKRYGPTAFISDADPGENVMYSDYYPAAGNIDNLWEPFPVHDLNFDTPRGIYYAAGGAGISPTTSNGQTYNILLPEYKYGNQFNRYWGKYINDITNPYAKIVKGTFRLSIKDIYDLDFSVPIRVHDWVMRLNKITDWNSNSDGLCTCEFLLKTAL
jgi:hypothetical protein